MPDTNFTLNNYSVLDDVQSAVNQSNNILGGLTEELRLLAQSLDDDVFGGRLAEEMKVELLYKINVLNGSVTKQNVNTANALQKISDNYQAADAAASQIVGGSL